jgi:hypothetical protein
MAHPVEWYPARIDQLALDVIEFTDKRIADNSYPTVEGICAKNKMSSGTIYELSKSHEGLKSALEYLKTSAKDCLVEGAMKDKFNAGFSKFVAINCHGMKEGINVEHSGAVSHEMFLSNVIRKAGGE